MSNISKKCFNDLREVMNIRDEIIKNFHLCRSHNDKLACEATKELATGELQDAESAARHSCAGGP